MSGDKVDSGDLTARERELKEIKKNLEFVSDGELEKILSAVSIEENDVVGKKPQKVTKVPKLIELEMDVPLGVFVVVKPTYIKDATKIFLRWEDEKKSCVPIFMDMNDLQNIKLVKKLRSKVKPGDYCVVDYEGDILNNVGKYRGLIKRLPGVDKNHEKTFLVHLIDIGCIEEIEDVYELPAKFYDQKRLCFQFGLWRYAQVDSPEAIMGVEEYLQKAFALYLTAVRVDVQFQFDIENPHSTQTMHWGEIHCFSGELCVLHDLLEKEYTKEKKNPTGLRSLGVNAVPVYLRVDNVEKNDESEEEQIKRAIQQYETSYGLEPYRPWLRDGAGELCLVQSPKSDNWLRGKVVFIDGNKAWLKLLGSKEIFQRNMLQLKEIPKSIL